MKFVLFRHILLIVGPAFDMMYEKILGNGQIKQKFNWDAG